MIELLGIGVPRGDSGWLLHRVCATLEAGEITAVVSDRPDERRTLLDAIAGRLVPLEGRVWVSGVPLVSGAAGRVRALCGDVDPDATVSGRRSVLWNVLAPSSGARALGRLLRLPRRRERAAAFAALERVGLRAHADAPAEMLSPLDRFRLLTARALARRPRHLVVREPDSVLAPADIVGLMALLRGLARSERLGIVVSLADGALAQAIADRVLVLGDGLLLFHGRSEAFGGARAAGRAGALTR